MSIGQRNLHRIGVGLYETQNREFVIRKDKDGWRAYNLQTSLPVTDAYPTLLDLNFHLKYHGVLDD